MDNSKVTRKIFIGGNWKCNDNTSFVKSQIKFLNEISFDNTKCEVLVCPSYVYLPLALSENKSNVIISAQNVSSTDYGAFTGEVNAKQLKDIGINWTLIGHSERRQLYGDSEEQIGKKLQIALLNNLNVVACIGEKLEERESNKTVEVVVSQLQTIKNNVLDWSKLVIAYEPVWAIGTGKTASPQQAQEVHAEIRKWISTNISEEAANNIRIIYGGSVTESNCNELISEKDIDGFLVGGASLKPGFKTIVESYIKKNN